MRFSPSCDMVFLQEGKCCMAQNKEVFEITRSKDGAVLITMSHPKAPEADKPAFLNPSGRVLMVDMGGGDFLAFARLNREDVAQIASVLEVRVAVELSRGPVDWAVVTLPVRLSGTQV